MSLIVKSGIMASVAQAGTRLRAQLRIGTALAEVRSVAAMEFAMVAPILLTMTLAVFDIARALLIWQQLNNAAEAIVQAAEKISVTTVNGAYKTTLTATQMQNVMTTVYAQIPGLNLGAGNGFFSGPFSVTLSSIVYTPLCHTTSTPTCNPGTPVTQTPYTLWSSYLTQSNGGTQLFANSILLRACYPTALVPVSQWPNTPDNLREMISPVLAGGTPMVQVPQIVADVQYVFTPNLPLWGFVSGPINFWASAALAAPLGGTDQEITYTTGTGDGPQVVQCTVPGA